MKIEELNEKDKIALYLMARERFGWANSPSNIKRLCQQLLDRGKYIPQQDLEKENTNDLTSK